MLNLARADARPSGRVSEPASGSGARRHIKKLTSRCITPFAVLAAGAALGGVAQAQQVQNWIATGAAASCLVIQAAPGSVDEIDVSSSAAGWAIVIDAAACPSNGAVLPVKAMPLGQAGAGQFAWSYAPPPALWFQNGVVVLVSSTGPFTYTAESTAFIMGVAR